MQPSTEKKLNLVLNFFLIFVGIAALYFFATKIFSWTLPFIFGLAVAYLVDPIISFLAKKIKIKRPFASVIAVVLTILFVISGLLLLFYRLMSELLTFAKQLPITYELVSQMIGSLSDKWEIIYSGLPLEISNALTYIFSSIERDISTIAEGAARLAINYAGNFASALPGTLVFIVVFVLASIFISADKENIFGFYKDIIPDSWKRRISQTGIYLKNAIGNYLRAVGILMLITFIELSIGLSVIGVRYALLFAAVIAIVDALPVFGCGAVLIPWSLLSFLTGDIRLGISLLVIYAIIYIVRQLVESRIVSAQIGIPPIVTLFSIYVGYKAIGVFGMIIAPITAVCIVSFYRASSFAEKQRKKKQAREKLEANKKS